MKKLLLLFACTATFLFAVDGKTIYQTNCMACHGQNGEVKPLGKDEIIKGMSENKIVKKLRKMKDENALFYFDSKKKLMKKQADVLSDEEIVAVAKYIITL